MTTPAITCTGTMRLIDGDLTIRWDNPPPPKAGIYEILLPNPVPRLRGSSRTLYIGRSNDLKSRLSQVETWAHGVTKRVDAVLRNGAAWGPTDERVCTVVARVTPAAGSDPELEEVRRLSTFEHEHCELPPLNRSAPGDFAFLALQRIMKGIADQVKTLKGVKSVKVQKPWDHEGDGYTLVELVWNRAVRLALVWVWPESWGGAKHRPDWWPGDERMPFRHQALYLCVEEEWGPNGRVGVKPGQLWCREREGDDPMLVHVQPIPLPGSLIDNPTDAFLALLAAGRLGQDGPELGDDQTMSQVLRVIWADISDRIGEVVRLDQATTRAADAQLAKTGAAGAPIGDKG